MRGSVLLTASRWVGDPRDYLSQVKAHVGIGCRIGGRSDESGRIKYPAGIRGREIL
jgi:hypothetical protein